MEAVMFWNKAKLSAQLWPWMKINLTKQNITLRYKFYGKNNRHFVFCCTRCNEKYVFVYDSKTPPTKIDEQLTQLAIFANLDCQLLQAGVN